MELAGGEHIFYSPRIVGTKLADATVEEIKKEKQKFKSMCFLQRADMNRYGELIEDLKKSGHRGRDEYPETIAGAYELLVRTSKQSGHVIGRSRRNQRFNQRRNGENYSFAQLGRENVNANDRALVPGNDGNTYQGITCFACGAMGHYAGNCPRMQAQTS